MMDSFESTNGMMGMGLDMDMDLGNEDDDFGGLSRGDLSRCPEALLGHYRSPVRHRCHGTRLQVLPHLKICSRSQRESINFLFN